MRVVIDIECNGLVNPTKVWVIVCKDIDTGQYRIWRNPSDDERERRSFLEYAQEVKLYIGHNFLGYDYPNLVKLCGLNIPDVHTRTVDTLVISKLLDYSRDGHSIEDYGQEFNLPKVDFLDFTKYSRELEAYCIRDVDICHKVYTKYTKYLYTNNTNILSNYVNIVNKFTLVCHKITSNGFAFNSKKANQLLSTVEDQLLVLDRDILSAFPPRLKFIKEIHPKVTKHGTLSKADFRFVKDGDLSDYNGGPFSRCQWNDFNPASHKQIIDVLTESGWKPIDKTKTHIETERELNKLKYRNNRNEALDIRLKELYSRMESLKKYGWKINEDNLSTLPPSAPSPARLLAKRILLESRRRTLTEWLSLVQEDGRIHAQVQAIGTWTHRTSTQKPNLQNIPNEFEITGEKKYLGKELRSLWIAPKNRLLVGVDAEGIQLRIFAHYIDDPEFTKSLVEGKKEDKSDPHSLNQRILGPVCRSRAAAKRFIYALLLGAGLGKLDEILGCSREETQDALSRLMERYQGFQYLKKEVIPRDGERGWFLGLDGRPVRIPGSSASERRHLAMSGYLQNGEAVVMEHATCKWHDKLAEDNSLLVDLIHDEWQVETPNNMEIALRVAKEMSDSLRVVGEELELKCPLAGSYWNGDKKDYTIGTNWSVTH